MKQAQLALTANFDLFGQILETMPKFDLKQLWEAL